MNCANPASIQIVTVEQADEIPAGSTLVWPDAIEPVAPARQRTPLGSLVLAVAGHAGLLIFLLWAPVSDGLGGGVVLDAIAVTITDGAALEAIETARAKTDAQAAAGVAVAAVQPSAEEVSAAAADAARTATDQEMVVLTAPEAEFTLPNSPPEIDPRPEKQASVNESKPAEDRTEPSPAESGAAARGAQWETVEAAAAAPPGIVRDYARSVMAAVAKAKPRAQSSSGTARVRFTVGSDGLVTDAIILATSGNVRLDAVALDAVKRAQFPAPPVTFSRADTTFVLPFYFR